MPFVCLFRGLLIVRFLAFAFRCRPILTLICYVVIVAAVVIFFCDAICINVQSKFMLVTIGKIACRRYIHFRGK